MAFKAQIGPFSGQINLLISQRLSPAARSKKFAEFAKAGIAEADAFNGKAMGRPVSRTVAVDGRAGASIDSVKPEGLIVAQWDVGTPAIIWIWNALRDRSPFLTGKYRRGHKLLADGAELLFGAIVPIARAYLFVNAEPYSHKIEVGKTESGRDFEIIVPNRIYERVAREADSMFGKFLIIEYDASGKSPTITVKARG
jgi:hypothetical protein